MIDMSIEEVVEFIKKHRTDEHGDIDLQGMTIEGSIDISDMKVKGCLWQDHQTVGRTIFQNNQTAGETIWQSRQTAGGNIFQCDQTAPSMYLQNTKDMEKDPRGCWVKKRTLEEKIKDSDLDEDLKKEIIAKLEEKK